jgi:hypothetical protein
LNVFLGNGTGYSNTTAHFNTFLGTQAGYSNKTGMANTYIGMNAGGLNTSGSNNVFLGAQAGYNEQASNRWSVIYFANGTIQTSDARLKTNVTDLNYGLESLLDLHPVIFTWKNDGEAKHHLGLLAQDVEKIINEVVDKGDDPSQTLGINYSELIPVLIKGIQEQQQQIERLKKLVEKLMEEKK